MTPESPENGARDGVVAVLGDIVPPLNIRLR